MLLSLSLSYVATLLTPVSVFTASIRLSFIPLALGTACMGISLPNFTAYTELYRGQVPILPSRHRGLCALIMLSPSMGILFGGWISAENADWPVAFNSAVLTFAVAMGYAGVSIFWSDELRRTAQDCERRLYAQEDSQAKERNEKPLRRSDSDRSLVTDEASFVEVGSSAGHSIPPSLLKQ